MGNHVFNRLERIVNVSILNAEYMPEPGLADGKAGMALFLHLLARRKGVGFFGKFASGLMENVVDSLHEGMSLDFRSGLTGIGWTVDYILHEGFEEGDADELLEEIDRRVAGEADGEQSVESIAGVLAYLCARIEHGGDDRRPETSQMLERALADRVLKLNAAIAEWTPGPVAGYDDTLFWLGRLAGKIRGMGIEVADIPARPVGDFASLPMGSASLHNGVAGRSLMRKLFGKDSFPGDDSDTVLENMPDNPASIFAGYDMTGVNHPFGLLNGVAGIGLALILT